MHHQPIARTKSVVSNDGHQLGFIARLRLAGGTIDQQGVVAHHADVQLLGHHAVGDGRARSEVLPVELELDVFVLASFWQVLLNQFEFFQHHTTGHRVGGGVLSADADNHFFSRPDRTGQDDKAGEGYEVLHAQFSVNKQGCC